MTSSQTSADISHLDQLTGGAFSAPTSGDRATRLRLWLETGPAPDALHDVYRGMASRDKGAAKVLKERMDEAKRLRDQDALVAQWAQKAEQLLAGARLNIADALAWQRDAAKAGAPLSREPLAGLKTRLSEVVKQVEDLQHHVMVQREAAVLVAQRIEVLSTKPLQEAVASRPALHVDVQAWLGQAHELTQQLAWPSVDMKFPPQLDASRQQLQAVWDGFDAALQLAQVSAADAQAPLPSVPVWADDVRALRGTADLAAPAPVEKTKSERPKKDPAERQVLRTQATKAVLHELELLEAQVTLGHGKASVGAAAALREVLKLHGRHMEAALDARVHQALTAAGEMEGWQRWRADQLREQLLTQAQALLDAQQQPTLGGRKMQEALRQLRDAWKQTDQGGMPNHVLWKKFDTACTQAYAVVQAWLDQIKQESVAQKTLRIGLLAEVQAWAAANAQSQDWREQSRALQQFAQRWRAAGHVSEKAYADLQARWKKALRAAAAPLDAAQKASIERRQALIAQAQELGAQPQLRVDAVRALQQRWQQEAQAVALERKTEQKLWDVFRKPIDDAFARKDSERAHSQTQLSARDQAVLAASDALRQANASGDAARIRLAVEALDAALHAQTAAAQPAPAPAAVTQPAPAAAPAATATDEVQVSETASADTPLPAEGQPAVAPDAQGEPAPAAAPAPLASVRKAVVAVRGDDRPGQKRSTPLDANAGRAPRAGMGRGAPGRGGDRPAAGPGRGGERDMGRGQDRGQDRGFERAERGPRLGDAAFRAQRDARESAEFALRKLAAQAHGEALTQVMAAWQERQADALPGTQALGKVVSSAVRGQWAQALAAAPQTAAPEALLRLEMAAQVPTPAAHLDARRALQLQLLTRRREAGPEQTWGQDVAQVLQSGYEESNARRLQTVLKALLKGA